MKATPKLGSSLAIVMLIALGLGTVPAVVADSTAAGRKHASKANQLAAKNKCKSAVVEFTKALKSIKDPTLLFNRAECYRKLDRAEDALQDYEQFLADMPEAPNRAMVEARIAALRGHKPPEAPATHSATDGAGRPAPTTETPPEKEPSPEVHRVDKWED